MGYLERSVGGELLCKWNGFTEIIDEIFNECETKEEIEWIEKELTNIIKASSEERAENTLNIEVNELEEKYGIFPNGDGRYLIPEHLTKTDYFLDKEKAEELGIDTEYTELREVCFHGLRVDEGDVLLLTLEKKGYNFDSIIRVENCINNTYGSFKGAYFSDDDRLDVVNAVANKFKDIKDVTVCNYLIYTKEETQYYIDRLEELD